jgi:hypothetical protein
MRSRRHEARVDIGTTLELVLTGRRLPGFGLLLAAMLAELTLVPFIEILPGGTLVVELITAGVLLAALAVAGAHRLALVLFATALFVHIAAGLLRDPVVLAVARVFRLVFLGYVIALVFRRVLRDREVTLDTVAGAACVYMLIGLVWGDLFVLLENDRVLFAGDVVMNQSFVAANANSSSSRAGDQTRSTFRRHGRKGPGAAWSRP